MLANIGIPSIIFDVSIIFGLAVIVLLACNWLKIPSLLGFLFTGIIAGPDVLQLTQTQTDISLFAEIGIVFLLFSIGLEFSLKDLLKARKQVLLSGVLQLLLTTLSTCLLVFLLNVGLKEALLLGLLVSFSSTAIVLKTLQDKGRVHSEQGKAALSVLIFQDIAVIPILLWLPGLSKGESGLGVEFFMVLIKAAVTVIVVVYAARSIIPRLLFTVAKSNSRELFLMTVLVICLFVAWLTSRLGLSLSLGAFLAGLIISESDYSHEAFSTILPFREVFTSFFFISIGLLVDLNFVYAHFFEVLAAVLVVVVVKSIAGGVSIRMGGADLRTAILGGMFIAQIGEFSFVLADAAYELKLLHHDNYQLLLSATVFTMGLTPAMLEKADRFTIMLLNLLSQHLYLKQFKTYSTNESSSTIDFKVNKDHLVIIGFSDIGIQISKVIKLSKIPFIAIDNDPEKVSNSKLDRGNKILYGNATDLAVLRHAHINSARMVVITLKNDRDIKTVIDAIRKISEHCKILAIANESGDFTRLFDAGANELLSRHFEISVESVIRILKQFDVPKTEIAQRIERFRERNYTMERSIRFEQMLGADLIESLPGTELRTLVIQGLNNNGVYLSELLMQDFSMVSILALKRGADIQVNPGMTQRVFITDKIIVFGPIEDLNRLERILFISSRPD
jgi:CPA2 family monovalent cation:H+ antiporter-2